MRPSEEKFAQLLMKIEPRQWQYKGPRYYTVRAGETLITLSSGSQDLKYEVALSKDREVLLNTTVWRRKNLYEHLQECERAAIKNNENMIEDVMDEFASVIFGVGDPKAASSITFEIDKCAPVEQVG